MPPRLNLASAFRALSLRTTTPASQQPLLSQKIAAAVPKLTTVPVARRFYSDNLTPENNNNNNDQAPSSELAPPRSEEEVVSLSQQQHKEDNLYALNRLELVAYGLKPFDAEEEGHKYGLPSLPLPSELHKDHRYDDVMGQITRLLMKDGKLSKAQRVRFSIPRRFDIYIYADIYVLGHGNDSQPPPHLPPTKTEPCPGFRGLAGGGRNLEVPAPLAARQRRRTAFVWILDAVQKRKSKGSGRKMFPTRVAEEIIAVVEGRSGVWDKRAQVHKLGTATRANLMNNQIKNFL
ncbi:uncharacterized protein PODANS_4_9320 [Podospora anserina S mat+]|uniref:Podospora anserina S mat+ genomic DNA chromosome 4, supercontig 4 n=1 Tax=Podospora anserina (strain S / ATCC MYA-4624 / DSM 980 / FGSC 10383) TaxID=515849 RepID=B2AQY0_PODAN|nr:uncharacterized protein PODANS_4_9320 [Podospora anserina S mat+]CAP66558.1 unnamed protein product [Podospora anserina S mat+]CDP28290.1 Putative protein of unknown function [Podospora anserina S mat+]